MGQLWWRTSYYARDGYDVDGLCSTIDRLSNLATIVEVYLEPGEGVVMNACRVGGVGARCVAQ